MVSLKVTGVRIKGLRTIRDFEMRPQFGGSRGLPDVLLIGGGNGAGKSTLLRAIFTAFSQLLRPRHFGDIPPAVNADEVVVQFQIGQATACFVVGDKKFVDGHLGVGEIVFGFRRSENQKSQGELFFDGDWGAHFWRHSPSVMLSSCDFGRPIIDVQPSSRATWPPSPPSPVVFERAFLAATGRKPEGEAFSRYADRGDSRSISHVAAVAELFGLSPRGFEIEMLFGMAELDLRGGQLLAFQRLIQLGHCWASGALVMIDDVDLHLHSLTQNRVYETLDSWRRGFGGQLILAANSAHLFHRVDPVDVGVYVV